MSKCIQKWILAGPADGLKTEIVMRHLVGNPVVQDRPFVFLCENNKGRAVDCAHKNGIEVFPISDPRFKSPDSLSELDAIGADCLVCCGWNFIVPASVFARFSYPCLNCHSSLLPDYKGQRAYLHQWANCEQEYGVTIHYINESLDEGKLLLQCRMRLFKEETVKIMHQRISEMTAALLPQALLLTETGYEGIHYAADAQSRYFCRVTPNRAKIHRWCNRVLSSFNLPLWLTPHK